MIFPFVPNEDKFSLGHMLRAYIQYLPHRNRLKRAHRPVRQPRNPTARLRAASLTTAAARASSGRRVSKRSGARRARVTTNSRKEAAASETGQYTLAVPLLGTDFLLEWEGLDSWDSQPKVARWSVSQSLLPYTICTYRQMDSDRLRKFVRVIYFYPR